MRVSRRPNRPFRVGLLVGVGIGVTIAAAFFRRQVKALLASFRPYRRRPYEAERPVLIINRWSGGGKAERLSLANVAVARGIRTVML
ncbi:MAG: hypothetical protein ACR2QK_12325, partial [Acidimicrobiales bacterium]